MEQDARTLYETLLETNLTLCEKFPSLNPLEVRRAKAREIFLLLRRMNKRKKPKTGRNGEQIIRRPAGDNWF